MGPALKRHLKEMFSSKLVKRSHEFDMYKSEHEHDICVFLNANLQFTMHFRETSTCSMKQFEQNKL